MSPFNKNKRYAAVAILVAALSTALYAAITFQPDLQPLVAVGPYELKNFDLAVLDNKAYRPWYENGAWQGDLIEYNVDGVGKKSITPEAPIDFTPVTDAEKVAFAAYGQASLDQANDAVRQTWMARTTFAAKEAGDSVGCAALGTCYWQTRDIFTWNGSSRITFKWNDMVSAGLAGVLDPVTSADPLLDSDPWASPTLNYVLGDHRLEKSLPGGTLRSRFSLLGDIVNSNPVYIGPPWENYIDPDFITFKTDSTDGYPDRAGIIAVGANDGMLHVLDEATGAEHYAYIPSMLIHKLDRLAVVPPYLHTYYVDGRLTSASAKVGTDWATVLTGGLGAGEQGLFALDVTAIDPASHTVLFEKTAADGFGHIYGKPSILRMPDGTWSVFTGNGLGTGNRAKLLIVNLDDYSVTALDTLESAPTGLAEPTLIDFDNDQIVDLAFAGDSLGNVWKFDFSTDPVTVTQLFAGSVDQPITAGVEVGEHPNGGYMVYWGTGNITSFIDAQDANYPPQAVYAVWEQARTGSVIVEQTLGEVADATFTNSAAGTTNTETVRYIATNPLLSGNYQHLCPTGDTGCTNLKGWKIELPNNGRLVGGAPQLRAARLSFITTNPIGVNVDPDTGDLNPDLEGDSWLMSLDYLTGGDSIGTERASINYGVAFNLNRDAVLDAEDMVDVSGIPKPPVGLRLGEGAISQPTIASLGPNVDKMYINGLILPFPQIEPGGQFFNGHIDVTTDSPGPEGGLQAPNGIAYMSQGYNVTTNDGLSGTIDGLSHEYDSIHGVNYVDLFDLEPRRGKTSLDGAPFPPIDGTCPINSQSIYDPDGALFGCVVTPLDAELNRAYDTLTRTVSNDNVSLVDGACPADDISRFGPFYEGVDASGAPLDGTNALDHCVEWTIIPASETYLMGGTAPIPGDKPFIITLANADLSSAGILQIGCRTWGAGEYQDMVTRQLEAGVSPASLVDEKYTDAPSGSLLLTLADIANGTKDPDGIVCPEDSRLPTLRVSFEQRSILDLGIHGTRSQCVLGLHQPEDKVCYSDAAVLSAAETGIVALEAGTVTPDDDPVCGGISGTAAHTPPVPTAGVPYYLQNPSGNWHITWNPNYPGSPSLEGFRWRNGALTLQLLDASNFTLQEPESLLTDKKGKRKGGTFAKAFDAEVDASGNLTGAIANRDSKGPNESGLLYEAAMFWHYGRLADDIRTAADLGSSGPSSTPCYGGNNYHSRLGIEAKGLNPGEINRIVDKEITEDELIAYVEALLAVQNCGDNEQACLDALLALGQMLANDPDLALLDSVREYLPEDFWDDLPPPGAGGDSIPNREVESLDINEDIAPQLIPNLRRSWIDLLN